MFDKFPPLWSPRFMYDDETKALLYKPFPRYSTWLVAWDLSDLYVLLDTLQTDVLTATDAANAAQASAEAAATLATDASAAALAAAEAALLAQGTADAAGVAAAAAQSTADDALAAAGAIVTGFSRQHFILPNMLHTVVGGFTMVAGVNSLAALNVIFLMSGLNSEADFIVGVPAGNYVIRIVGERYNGGADCSLYVDGVLHSMNHFYSALAVHAYEAVYIVNGLSNGLHTFGLKITGRQPANTTAYNLYLSFISVSPNP